MLHFFGYNSLIIAKINVFSRSHAVRGNAYSNLIGLKKVDYEIEVIDAFPRRPWERGLRI